MYFIFAKRIQTQACSSPHSQHLATCPLPQGDLHEVNRPSARIEPSAWRTLQMTLERRVIQTPASLHTSDSHALKPFHSREPPKKIGSWFRGDKKISNSSLFNAQIFSHVFLPSASPLTARPMRQAINITGNISFVHVIQTVQKIVRWLYRNTKWLPAPMLFTPTLFIPPTLLERERETSVASCNQI